MHHIGREFGQIGAHAVVDAQRQAVFAATLHRHSDVGNVDQVAGRGEIGFGHDRGIDAQRRALPEQEARQAVERLVRAIASVIVVPAEQRDAKIGHIHCAAL